MNATIPFDAWTALLAVGIVASFVCTVVMIAGISTGRRSTKAAERRPALPISSASAVRERAVARAEAAAAASRVHVLTDARLAGPGDPAHHPAGHDGSRRDGHVGNRAVTADDAVAIVAQFVEHDPRRIAEVITEWIRADSPTPKPERR